MISRTFTCREHEEYGILGWLADDAPNGWEPASSMTVAHDLIEHTLTDDGSPEDEAKALGAIIYVRGEGGYFRGLPNPHVGNHLGHDISDFIIQGRTVQEIKNCLITLEDHLEEEVNLAITEAQRLIRAYYQDGHEDFILDMCAEAEHYRPYLKMGCLDAFNRYDVDPTQLTHIFNQIQERLNKIKPSLGDKLEISLCPRTGDYNINYTSWEDMVDFSEENEEYQILLI